MELKQLTAHVYYTECDPRTDRPVLGYVLGSRESIMVDAGNSANHVADYQDAVKRAGFSQPAHCVITHWHWDHTFGMHAVDAEIIAHEKTNRELCRMAAWEWNDSAMKRRLESGEEIEFADTHIRAEYDCLQEIRVISAGKLWEKDLILDCGEVTCHCMHLPSAHSDDSLVVWIPEEKVLFVGDIYNDDFYNHHYRDPKKTKQLYEALHQIDFETAVPGHSAPVKKADLMNFLGRVQG